MNFFFTTFFAHASARFGDRLDKAIAQAYGSKSEFAERLGVKPQQVSNWLARDKPPSLETVHRLSEALGVPEAWLAYGVVPSGGVEESPEDAVALDWPDVSMLKEGAREYYDRIIGEFAQRSGWTLETVVAAATELTSFLREESILASEGPGRPDLSEEEQLMVLRATKPVVERAFNQALRTNDSRS